MPDDHLVRFGDGLELDAAAYQLRRSGSPLRLERIPFDILCLLIDRPGQLVSREDIIARIWGKDVFLDTDTSINSAIRKIRLALRDDPENPAYIQTVTGKGYRFIAPITPAFNPPADANPTPTEGPRPTPAKNVVILSEAPERAAGESNGAQSKDPDAPRTAPPPDTFQSPLASPDPSTREKSPTHLLWAAIAILLLAAAGLAAWKLRPAPQPLVLSPTPFTTYHGNQNAPSFSPDGTQIAFQWDGPKQDNIDIYVKGLSPDATPLRLTTDPAPDMWPAWSPDGATIAFQRAISPSRMDLMLIPALGGPERKLAEFPFAAGSVFLRPAWSQDSQWIIVPESTGESVALFRVSAQTGESTQITHPNPGLQDIVPAISPDSSTLIFTRNNLMFILGDLYRVPLAADALPLEAPRLVYPDGSQNLIANPVWTADGRQIIATNQGRGPLPSGAIRLSPDGSAAPIPIPWMVGSPHSLATSLRGDRLAYAVMGGDANIWRIDLSARTPQPEPLVNSTARDIFPQYSPDGTRLAFYSYRSGVGQVWVSNADGTQPQQITFVKQGQAATPHWSPDGRTLAIDSNQTGTSQVYLIGANGGSMKPLTQGPVVNFGATWSHDGSWLYFTSKRSGRSEVWRMPAHGGPATQITDNGGSGAIESADGKTLYFAKEIGDGSIWRMPLAGGPEEHLADSLYRTNFAVTARGVYYMTNADDTRNSTLMLYTFATGKSTTILRIGRPEYGLDVSPDGRYLTYAQLDNPGSNLMLIENFH